MRSVRKPEKVIQLHPFQIHALRALQKPGHVICVAPTGSGKSLIYERFSRRGNDKKPTKTLLISPLVALGRQQAARLRALGFRVWLGMGPKEPLPPDRKQSEYWIVSPEKLTSSPNTLHALREWRPDWLVVDECHCLWEWGEDFRPAYREIPPLLSELKLPRSLWLTATLPHAARVQLRTALPKEITEIGSFAFPENLSIRVQRIDYLERPQALLDTVRNSTGPGIVFAQTREDTHRLARLLAPTTDCLAYHAGLSAEERQAIEIRFRQGKGRVLVATSAFGLGMDIRDLEWVVLWEPPRSLLALAQSLGRVGRAGKAGQATVFWDEVDSARGDASVMNWLRDLRCRRESIAPYFSGPETEASAVTNGCSNDGSKCDRCLSRVLSPPSQSMR